MRKRKKMRSWEGEKVGRKAEGGMRKWELKEVGMRNLEVGKERR
jgi:hypothetical protein